MDINTYLLLLCLSLRPMSVYAAPRIEMDRRKAVVNLPLTITCTSEVTITSSVVFYIDSTVSKGGCTGSGICGSGISRYSVTQDRAQRTTTLTISSVDSTEDTGTWYCGQEGEGNSGNLHITQFASVLDWTSVSYSPSLSSLPSSVTPQQTVTVTVITPCAAPQAIFSWRYQQSVSGSPPSSTSTSQESCPAGQVQTINTLSLPGNTPSLFNKLISLTVSVEHDSFDPPTYTRSATSSSIQFPAPVASVTLQEISSDNEKVRKTLGTSLTLTCVTSASFPISTVTWSGLPSGTAPTARTSTSGLLKTTTSSVTFTLSKGDQDRTIQCTASNINGQTSPQSNIAVLEVQYAPIIATSFPANQNVVENSSLNIDCSSGITAGSPSDISFTWTGPGDYSSSVSVLDRRVSRSQGGYYTCTATNSAGLSDSAQVNINVQSSPFTPTNFYATSVGPSSLTLKWISNDNGGAIQTFHLEFRSYTSNWINALEIGIPDPGQDIIASTEVRELHASTRYSFTVFSTNVCGDSGRVTLNVTTSEAATPSCFNAGVIAATVTALCLLAVLGLMTVCLFRRGALESRCLRRGQKTDEANTIPASASELSTATVSPYCALEPTHSDTQKKTAEYEEPTHSSTITSPAYENTELKQKDPMYINAS